MFRQEQIMSKFSPFFFKFIQGYSHSKKGLTLIEVLAAIVLLSVIIITMAPPLLLSAATRVKMRRASQARLIAQEQLNSVQTIMMRSRDQKLPTNDDGKYKGLPPIISGSTSSIYETPPPSNLIAEDKQSDSATDARRVDVNNDGEPDFFVQVFREQGALFSAGQAQCEPALFRMGVRVYSILAEDNLNELETEKISLQMTNGLKGQNTNPMAVLYTEVSRSDREFSLNAYRDYLTGNGVPNACSSSES
jgi:prepilin-type N-terminal cleavage/methylation domain-containing protein